MTNIEQIVKHLRSLNAQLTQGCDQADARMRDVNDQIHELARTGLINPTFYLGPIIHSRDYSPRPDGHDSRQIIQAALSIPNGIGAVFWDSDDYLHATVYPEGLESDAVLYFRPFAKCEPAIRAKLLPHIDRLMEKLFGHLGE